MGDILAIPTWTLAGIMVIATVLLVLGYLGYRRWRRQRPVEKVREYLEIDIAEFPEQGPTDQGPQLTCYGIPVRVVVVVLAPSGRHGKLPATDTLPALIESIVPGLRDIVIRDRPQLKRWPPQLSTHGFIQAFFANVRLPGNRGKETPWCSTVGRVEFEGQSYLAGLVLCASRPNALGPIEIEHAGKWLDILRLRT